LKQCLLGLRDARDHNGEGVLYGFVTTGEDWVMISYDGREVLKPNKLLALFDTMGAEKGKRRAWRSTRPWWNVYTLRWPMELRRIWLSEDGLLFYGGLFLTQTKGIRLLT